MENVDKEVILVACNVVHLGPRFQDGRQSMFMYLPFTSNPMKLQ